MNLMNLLLDSTEEESSGTSWLMIVIYVIIIAAIIYFMMVRPQRKQRKQQEALNNSIEPGDSVLTTSGFYGTIVSVNGDTIIVEFGNNKNCRIPMSKQAISQVEKANASSAPAVQTGTTNKKKFTKKDKAEAEAAQAEAAQAAAENAAGTGDGSSEG